ncbi:MAG TPA: hypothetical protein VGC12_05300, partial [Methyloradius sp.]
MSATIQKKVHLNVRISEYAIPPVKDMLVMGRDSAVGCIAMRRAIELLVKAPFEHIELSDDDIIGDILVRQAILKRVPKDDLIDFVLTHLKPLLGAEEVLQVDVDVDVFLV